MSNIAPPNPDPDEEPEDDGEDEQPIEPTRTAPPVTPSGAGVPANVPPWPLAEGSLPTLQLADWTNPAQLVCAECGQPYGRFKVDPYTGRQVHTPACGLTPGSPAAGSDTPIPRRLQTDAPPQEPRTELPRPETVGN